MDDLAYFLTNIKIVGMYRREDTVHENCRKWRLFCTEDDLRALFEFFSLIPHCKRKLRPAYLAAEQYTYVFDLLPITMADV